MSDQPFTWQSSAITDVGKVRKLNEDSLLDRGKDGLWVVADGMGGHSAGDLASQLIVNSLDKLDPSDDLAVFDFEHVHFQQQVFGDADRT